MPQKYILLPSAKRYSPPDEHALYNGNFATGNGELQKVIADMKTAAQERKSFFYFKSANLSKSLLKLTM